MVLKNPFADYGGIVTGERFVGRKKEIEVIKNRLLGNFYGNIAIEGLPRIGKSSLAWNSIFTQKDDLVTKKIIPIWVPFGEYNSLINVFYDVLFEIEELLSNGHEKIEALQSIKTKIDLSNSDLEKRRYIKRYFKLLRTNGYRVIIVFDEFDNAANVLELQDFQFLRELSYNIESKIGLLTISRKTIQELEPDNGALSNFYQIFTELRLKLFSNDDLESYWKRIEQFSIEVNLKYKGQTKIYCGAHPYLLDVLNHEVFNNISQTDVDLETTFSKIVNDVRLKLFNEYEAILNLMFFEGLSDKLMQVIIGPVYDISQRDVERLLKYDIIGVQNDKNYSCFSDYFNDYLSLKSREIDIWPLWSDVEEEVRSLIKEYLLINFGESWEIGYEKKFKQKKSDAFLLTKKEIQNRNKSLFGDKASDHLVDYTYPMEMFDRFIAIDWEWFSKIFIGQKSSWNLMFQHLGKIRNPLAHNNPNFLSDSDKNLAEGYCKMILSKINDWKSIN